MTSQLPKQLAIAAGGLTFLTGLVVLFGWAFDIVLLKEFASGGTKMSPATALCFVLTGIALWSAAEGIRGTARHRLAVFCFGLVGLVGALKLVDYLGGWRLGFADDVVGPSLQAKPVQRRPTHVLAKNVGVHPR